MLHHALDSFAHDVQFPIVNTQIHIRQGNPVYDAGIQQNAWIQDLTGKPYVGQVSPLVLIIAAVLATDRFRSAKALGSKH